MKLFLLLLGFCIFSASAQSHWESIILAENTWSYLEGNSEPANTWNTLSFDDSSWKQGAGGLGYNDGDDVTVVESVASLYLRISFHVSALSQIEDLLLDIDYDDGFVAYINGKKIARSSNVTTDAPLYNSGTSIDREALMYNGGLPERHIASLSPLKVGENVLAIHILNYNATSSDLSARPYLHAKLTTNTTIYQNTPSWFVAPILYNSSNLPIVKINTSGQNIVDDPKITAYMGIINNGEGQLNHLTDTFTDYDGYIGIETRGQSSQMFPKKSYSFETRDELDENFNVNLLGMPKENDWILYAPYSDKSMLRNAITFGMTKSLDMYSSRMAYCELYVNDSYEGIYILMEKVKRDDSRVDVDSLLSIYGDDNSLSGGYIFKVDKKDADYVNLYTGWTTYPNPSYPNAMDITFQYVYPKAKDVSIIERNYLKDKVTEAERVLISSGFSNKETGYNNFFNLGSFVDFMLINEVSKEVDKYRYSTYFHKKKDSKGGEIFAGPIWDFNLGYGNVNYWDVGNQTSGWLYSDVRNVDYSIMFWWKRLMEDPHFESIASSRFHDLRQNEWSDNNVTYLIDSITAYIDEAQIRNYTRWPILGTYVWPNKWWQDMTYTDEVETFKTWILERLHWMDANLSGSILTPAVTLTLSDKPSSSSFIELEVTLEDQYFNHKYLKKKHFDIKMSNQDLLIDTVWYQNASAASLILTTKEGVITNPSFSIEVDDNILTGFDDLLSNTLTLASGINNQISEPNISVYAVNQQITIETTQPELLGQTLQVYNIEGRLITQYPLYSLQKNTKEMAFSKGIYLVHFIFDGKRHTEKIRF